MTNAGAICPQCHSALPDKDTFCVNCGARVDGTLPKPVAAVADLSLEISRELNKPGAVKSYPMLHAARAILKVLAILCVGMGIYTVIYVTRLVNAARAYAPYTNAYSDSTTVEYCFLIVGVLIGAGLTWALADLIDIALRVSLSIREK